MDRSAANPFLDDVFVNQATEIPGVSQIHNHVFQRIADATESLIESGNDLQTGRIFLVTAPRAGYGKSHLTARLRDHLRSMASTIPLPFDRSRPTTWPVALNAVLRQLSYENRKPDNSLNSLLEITRHALSRIILERVNSGRLQPKDLPCSEEDLRTNYCEILHPDSPSRVIQWTEERLPEFSQGEWPSSYPTSRLRPSELGFWSRIFVDLNLRGDGALEPLRGLSTGEARERLLQLLAIATASRPVVFLADGLDGFYDSATAGMEIAEILTSLRENVSRSITVLMLNEEIWEAVFEGKLPTAWLDRITGESSKLRSIPPEVASDLIVSRLARVGINGAVAEEFVQKLGDEHLWIDAETKISPRIVLRQACEMWDLRGREILESSSSASVEEETAGKHEPPLEELTDKAEFFASLQEDSEPSTREVEVTPEREQAPPPLTNPFFAPTSPVDEKTDPEPEERVAPTPEEAVVPELTSASQLVDIDSIINDIRGTGKSVVSEVSFPKDVSFPDAPPPLPPSGKPLQAGELQLKEKSSPPNGFTPHYPGFQDPPATKSEKAAPEVSDPAERLKERETEILSEGDPQLDLDRLEHFLCSIGKHHAGLSQKEERFPGTRTVCLQWKVRRLLVLIGFETPENVFFWNTLLQRTLSSESEMKVSAFSHTSKPFDPGVFSEFGFSRAIVEQRIDIIEMGDRELAMIYSADELLHDLEASPDSEDAVQQITRYLDPLWRRISKPL